MEAELFWNKLKSLAKNALSYEAERVEVFKRLNVPWGAACLTTHTDLEPAKGGESATDLEPNAGKPRLLALIEADALSVFSAVLLLAKRNTVEGIDLFIGSENAQARAELYARWFNYFNFEATLWQAQQAPASQVAASELSESEPAEISPELAELAEAHDLAVVVDHGDITFEYLGLEIARVTTEGGQQRLEVGVGTYDQAAFAVMNPDLVDEEALKNVLAQVKKARHSEAESTPLKRMSLHRWKLHELIAEPEILGLKSLKQVESFEPKGGIKDESVALAVGEPAEISAASGPVTLGVISSIDLAAIPTLCDIANRHGSERAILAGFKKDLHPTLKELASLASLEIDFHILD